MLACAGRGAALTRLAIRCRCPRNDNTRAPTPQHHARCADSWAKEKDGIVKLGSWLRTEWRLGRLERLQELLPGLPSLWLVWLLWDLG
jgi:hypothetical protein